MILRILILTTLCTTSLTHAAEPTCYDNLCVGDRVIDKIKRVGVIQGFEGNTAVYSSEHPFAAHQIRSFYGYLSKQKIATNPGRALDPHNRTGEIIYTFENEFVLMKFDFGFSVLSGTEIRREIKKEDSAIGSVLGENEWVATDLNLVGVVNRYYENNTFSIIGIDGANLVTDLIYREAQNYMDTQGRPVTIGTPLLHVTGNKGKIEHVFSNGTISMGSITGRILNREEWSFEQRDRFMRIYSTAICSKKPYQSAMFSHFILQSDLADFFKLLQEDLSQNRIQIESRACRKLVENSLKTRFKRIIDKLIHFNYVK